MLLKVSLNAAAVSAIAFGFDIVNSIWLVPPTDMVGMTKAFTIIGALALTVRFAVFETAPVGAFALATPVVAFGSMPGVLDVTRSEMMQLPAAGIVRPAKLSNPV